ncbi:Phospholipase/carboxylesterase/thioesterase [Usnea florida]
MSNDPPIIIPAPSPSTSPATIIFLHGLGDDANGWTDLVSQFHSAHKLPHLKWILPNAPQNRDVMAQAWYMPKPFSPIPMPKRSGEPDPDEDEEEDDEEGMMKSVEYITGLIDTEVQAGVPVERIVVGGFSQGCAISLLVGLMGRHKGTLGGVVGLSGYLPLSGKVEKMMEEGEERGLDTSQTKWFLAHGSRDQLVPKRLFMKYREKIERWEKDRVEARLYEGMGHATVGAEIKDLCESLERVVPLSKT